MESNGICNRQNSIKCLRLLASQRQIYRECKLYENLIIVFSVLLPFVSAIIQSLYNANNIINAITYIVTIAGMFVGVLTSKYVEKMQETAASIQQSFDLEVFQLPWDNKLFGDDRNLNLIISEKSKKILANSKEHDLLLNWYPNKYDSLPLNRAILFCQRTNISWDSNIRSIYKISSSLVSVILVFIILIISVINNDALLIFLSKLIFILPIMQWLLNTVNSLNKDIRRIGKFKEVLFMKPRDNKNNLLTIQSYIFEHRKNCTLIPEWFYYLTKKKQENIMQTMAEMEIEEQSIENTEMS